jgi:MFS transporter, LPLT family, lysophospholipid transporter
VVAAPHVNDTSAIEVSSACPVYSRPADTLGLPLDGRAAHGLFAAHLLSAASDHAMLITAFGMLAAAGDPVRSAWLQQAYLLPFVLLAPFVGPLADSLRKNGLLVTTNGIKLLAALAMASGLDPLLAHVITGIGAAAYSPAKYGILAQYFTAADLVKANARMEAVTVLAVLVGVPSGALLHDHFGATPALAFVVLGYSAALLMLRRLVPVAPENPAIALGPSKLAVDFIHALRELWQDAQARFTLAGTALFWASGTALRLLLLAWVPVALARHDTATPAVLMAVVAIGIAVGAIIASQTLSTRNASRALPSGLLLGPLVLLLTITHTFTGSVLVLSALGLAGGFFVVPLNALLQDRGHHTVGTGRALSVQNFTENLGMTALVGLLMGGQYLGLHVNLLVTFYGLIVFFGMVLLSRMTGARRTHA